VYVLADAHYENLGMANENPTVLTAERILVHAADEVKGCALTLPTDSSA
jgi:hypothetical protein